MTVNEAIETVLNIARAEIGYHEKASNQNLDDKKANSGSGNYTKYARDLDATKGFYNGKKQGFSWCDMFHDWPHVKAWGAEMAKKVLYQPDSSAGAGCLYSARYYMNNNRFFSTPRPGDQIFFLVGGEIGHTGIVVGVSDTDVVVIEGNSGNCVAQHTYKRSNPSIAGYGRPNYELAAASMNGEKPVRQLKKGCSGEDVKRLQEDLISIGYALPQYGADGDFGSETLEAVLKFQEDNGLEVDGVVGENTLAAIEKLKGRDKEMAIRNDESALYSLLRQRGLLPKAASVVLGHGQEESGTECYRIQGDFTGDRAKSISYTNDVDSGKISRDDFIFHGPNGGGYGWLQWTFWARKAGLWNKAKNLGVSVGSVKAAVEWFWDELHQPEYSEVLHALQSDMSIREMSDVFMHKFERPADQSEAACARRSALCQQMFDKYAVAESNKPADEPVKEKFWPPRMLCLGMEGPDVEALQGLLAAHGYACSDERGVFDNSTDEQLRNYQKDNRLEIDGVAGPMTFGALTKL